MSSNDPNVNYKSITEKAIDKHAPLKKKIVRGNQALLEIEVCRKQYTLEPN